MLTSNLDTKRFTNAQIPSKNSPKCRELNFVSLRLKNSGPNYFQDAEGKCANVIRLLTRNSRDAEEMCDAFADHGTPCHYSLKTSISVDAIDVSSDAVLVENAVTAVPVETIVNSANATGKMVVDRPETPVESEDHPESLTEHQASSGKIIPATNNKFRASSPHFPALKTKDLPIEDPDEKRKSSPSCMDSSPTPATPKASAKRPTKKKIARYGKASNPLAKAPSRRGDTFDFPVSQESPAKPPKKRTKKTAKGKTRAPPTAQARPTKRRKLSPKVKAEPISPILPAHSSKIAAAKKLKTRSTQTIEISDQILSSDSSLSDSDEESTPLPSHPSATLPEPQEDDIGNEPPSSGHASPVGPQSEPMVEQSEPTVIFATLQEAREEPTVDVGGGYEKAAEPLTESEPIHENGPILTSENAIDFARSSPCQKPEPKGKGRVHPFELLFGMAEEIEHRGEQEADATSPQHHVIEEQYLETEKVAAAVDPSRPVLQFITPETETIAVAKSKKPSTEITPKEVDSNVVQKTVIDRPPQTPSTPATAERMGAEVEPELEETAVIQETVTDRPPQDLSAQEAIDQNARDEENEKDDAVTRATTLATQNLASMRKSNAAGRLFDMSDEPIPKTILDGAARRISMPITKRDLVIATRILPRTLDSNRPSHLSFSTSGNPPQKHTIPTPSTSKTTAQKPLAPQKKLSGVLLPPSSHHLKHSAKNSSVRSSSSSQRKKARYEPPRQPSPPSSSSSTPSPASPSPEDQESNAEMSESTEWHLAVEPHHRDLLGSLIRVSHSVLRGLQDSEAAIEDVVDDYKSDGDFLIENLEERYRTRVESQREGLRRAAAWMTDQYHRTLEVLRGLDFETT
jgi:hypothetical protein